jgi:hypothetical protein
MKKTGSISYMEAAQWGDNAQKPPLFFRWAILLLWIIVILSALFMAMIFVVPLETYQFFGNFFETAVAVFCMTCNLYAYRSISDRTCFLLAAFAFFSYALSNAYWYIYTTVLGRSCVFTSVAEFGFICFFLFLIAAISIEFTDEGMAHSTAAGLLVLFLAIPVIFVLAGKDLPPVRLALLFIGTIVVGQLVATAIRYGVFRYPVLWAGICLTGAATILYDLRETVFTSFSVMLFPGTGITAPFTAYDFLSIVGPMAIGSFALIQLGLFSSVRKSRASGSVGMPLPERPLQNEPADEEV